MKALCSWSNCWPNPQLDLLQRPRFALVTLLTLYKQLSRWVPLWCEGQTPCAVHHYLLLSAWCSIVFAFSKISHDATACVHICLWFAESPCSLYASEELRQGHGRGTERTGWNSWRCRPEPDTETGTSKNPVTGRSGKSFNTLNLFQLLTSSLCAYWQQ